MYWKYGVGEKVGSVIISFLVLPDQEPDGRCRVHFYVIRRKYVEKMRRIWGGRQWEVWVSLLVEHRNVSIAFCD